MATTRGAPRRRRRTPPARRRRRARPLIVAACAAACGGSLRGPGPPGWGCRAYHHAPCISGAVRRQFQFSDCYVPNLNPDLALGRASFVMAHDAATGYLNTKASDGDGSDGAAAAAQRYDGYDGVDDMNGAGGSYATQNTQSHPSRWNTITTQLLSLYGKTQAGSVYDQLNDGARALDLRPKIYANGTVGFHHGSLIDVPLDSVTLTSLLADAKQWCNDNPKELVLVFHSELVHEAGYNGLSSQVYLEVDDDAYVADAAADDARRRLEDADADADAEDAAYAVDDDGETYEYFYSGIAKLREVYRRSGVPYYPCERLANLTVGEAMEMADLSRTGGKGYLLAVDRHDMYGE